MKALLKSIFPNAVLKARATYLSLQPIADRRCNLCEFYGKFDRFGRPPRLDAECPKCKSLERHRLLNLVLEKDLLPRKIDAANDKVLHFAPEHVFKKKFRDSYNSYKTADLFAYADLKLNLEEIDLPDESIDIIIANHVLEHVDDKKAGSELYRILAPKGILICMVPIVEGWSESYENPEIKSASDRWLHFGQYDHVRFYGSDFRERILAAGFESLTELTAEGQDVMTYGLMRGEKVFVFSK